MVVSMVMVSVVMVSMVMVLVHYGSQVTTSSIATSTNNLKIKIMTYTSVKIPPSKKLCTAIYDNHMIVT